MKQQIRIAQIELNNFRGFDSVSVSFDKSLTVFIGNNGSGKTTILEAIAGSLQYVKEQVQDRIQKVEQFRDTDIRVASDVHKFKTSLVFSEPSAKLNAIYQRRNRTSFNFIETKIDEDEKPDYEIESTLKTWYEDNKSLEIMAYYPCQSISVENGQAVNFNVFNVENAYDESLDGRFNFSMLNKWLIWQYSLRQERHSNIFFEQISEAIIGEQGILNDVDKRHFDELSVTYQSKPEGSLLFVKGGAALAADQLSSGEKLLFALVADIGRRLITANPHSENPIAEGSGIVLIDEIDLHLHPSWQRKVIGKLQVIFPNVQFVVTTHSPVVLSNIYSKHIRIIADGKVYGAEETFGQSVNDILEDNMHTESSEFGDEIKKLFELIDANDITEAKALKLKLESLIEGTRPELVKANAFIQRKELVGK
jgi:predicted ATP-binding protein involved in virulence